MERIALIIVLLLAFVSGRAVTTQRDTLLHFASDQHDLTAEALITLEAFVNSTIAQGEAEFTITGHTDSDADNNYNERLAQLRAKEVREFLLQRGVPEASIRINAFGERMAVATNENEEGQALNRRVQITATVHRWESTADLTARLRQGSEQVFRIDPTLEQSLTTAAGATVQLGSLSLVAENGRPATGPVDLHITDALGLESIIGHRLSTVSGDQLLETGGMLKIEAVDAAGNALVLDPTKPMTITLPTEVKKDGMQLFLSDNGSNWATAQPIINSWSVQDEGIKETYKYQNPPALKWPAMEYMQYTGSTPEPRKPISPAMPREPLKPVRERYTTAWNWWTFTSKAAHAAEDQARFDKAHEAYLARMEKFHRQVKQYKADSAAFPQRLEEHAEAMGKWACDEEASLAAWQRDVYQPAFELYERRKEAVRPRNDSIMAAWRVERDSAFSAYVAKADSTGTGATSGLLNAYVFAVSSLGWINCDRFYGSEEPQSIIAFRDPDATEEEVFLVFTGIKSILAIGKSDQDRYTSPRVPVTEPAILFAYKVQDGKPMLCKKPVDRGQRQSLQFEPSSFTEIRSVLKELDGRGT
ncbi:MAG: OmpA family protein [Flavobacteriales bacterium]|nr:MAG: OmpA family protein [Flavobacteriales bacterium]